MAATDDELIARTRTGDRSALDELLRRHYDRIYAVCRRIAGNDADAMDATQDALMAIVRGLDNFDGRSRFSTWTYRVATNACLDELRRRRRRPEPTDDAILERPGRERTGLERPGHRNPGRSQDDHSAAVADRLAIDEAMQRINEQFRAPVVLRDLCDLDYREIAQILDLPPGTVRSRIARGRAALAEALGNREPSPERHRASDE